MWRNNSVLSLFMGSFYSLPSPVNLSYWWNMGSLLGLVLSLQIVTGLLLTMRYAGDVKLAFCSVCGGIMREVSYSWVFRYMHANGASFFLALMYLHVGRGLYYKRYYNVHTWLISVVLMVLSFMTAFLGYVLLWGQMSFWAATVITNLISVIPMWSPKIVAWVWGGFCVDNAALTRFYTLHFLTPFIIAVMALLHLVSLHEEGSGNPVSDFSGSLKIYFWPYFSVKDALGALILVGAILMVAFLFPDYMGDPDNYHSANPMITPVHIKPEWYFLFAYAILRCVPNKGMGVVALIMSIVVMAFMPLGKRTYTPSLAYQAIFWVWAANFVMLTWLGGCPVKTIYTYMAQVSGFLYFFLLFLMTLV